MDTPTPSELHSAHPEMSRDRPANTVSELVRARLHEMTLKATNYIDRVVDGTEASDAGRIKIALYLIERAVPAGSGERDSRAWVEVLAPMQSGAPAPSNVRPLRPDQPYVEPTE